MNLDSLQNNVARAVDAQAAIERDAAQASPEHRTAMHDELGRARASTEEARRVLRDREQAGADERSGWDDPKPQREVNGFGGADLTREEAQGKKAPDDGVKRADSDEQKREPQTVRRIDTHHHSAIGPMRVYERSTMTERHVHPDIAEARQVNAERKAGETRSQAEKAIEAKAEAAREKAEKKDMQSAARLYEGGHARGITREGYVRMETEWKQQLDANPEKRAELAKTERAGYIAERSQRSQVEHREAAPGEKIEGKVTGVRTFGGVKHTVVETDTKPPKRVVIEGEIKGAQLGKKVEVSIDDKGRIAPPPAAREPERGTPAPTRSR